MDTVTIRVDRHDIEGATNVQQFQGALTLQVCVGTYTLVLVYFSFKLINLFISISSSHQKSTHNVACSLFLPIDGPSGGFQGSGPLALGLTMISPKRREQRVVWDL